MDRREVVRVAQVTPRVLETDDGLLVLGESACVLVARRLRRELSRSLAITLSFSLVAFSLLHSVFWSSATRVRRIQRPVVDQCQASEGRL